MSRLSTRELLAKKKAMADGSDKAKKRRGKGLISRALGGALRGVGSVVEFTTRPARKFAGKHKGKILAGTLTAATLGGAGFYWFGMDYATKRQDYPVRNILYRSAETIHYEGVGSGTGLADLEHISLIHKGDTDEGSTKLGEFFAKIEWEKVSNASQYHLKDSNNRLIASATVKEERVQPGMKLRGAINFSERSAHIEGEEGKYITYSIIPDRGFRHLELNIVQENGERRLVNLMETRRSWWKFWDREVGMRDSTALYEFPDVSNAQIAGLFEVIDTFNRSATDKGERWALINDMIKRIDDLERRAVYFSQEDGILDWIPQESSMYLFADPHWVERVGMNFQLAEGNGKPVRPLSLEEALAPREIIIDENARPVRLRVENHWNFFPIGLSPGNYPFLNKIKIGSGENVWRPFSHFNNGGYTIKDGRGTIARIDVEDFWLHYGDDVVYHYYLDKNGDGKIQERSEHIGSVHYGVSRDRRNVTAEQQGGDVSKEKQYTFMAGSSGQGDMATADVDFYLSNCIESFLANEVNRGFGKHSYLGRINNERSNILLREGLTIENMGRALTPESSIVAKSDIVALLHAAGRTYIDESITVDN